MDTVDVGFCLGALTLVGLVGATAWAGSNRPSRELRDADTRFDGRRAAQAYDYYKTPATNPHTLGSNNHALWNEGWTAYWVDRDARRRHGGQLTYAVDLRHQPPHGE